jgi:phage-related protein
LDIRYYQTASGRRPAGEYIDGLPEADLELIIGDFEVICEKGIPGAPIDTRHLGGRLWELKSGRRKQQRIFYFINTDNNMVLLHACKKQRGGAQRRDVDTAKKRLSELTI